MDVYEACAAELERRQQFRKVYDPRFEQNPIEKQITQNIENLRRVSKTYKTLGEEGLILYGVTYANGDSYHSVTVLKIVLKTIDDAVNWIDKLNGYGLGHDFNVVPIEVGQPIDMSKTIFSLRWDSLLMYGETQAYQIP